MCPRRRPRHTSRLTCQRRVVSVTAWSQLLTMPLDGSGCRTLSTSRPACCSLAQHTSFVVCHSTDHQHGPQLDTLHVTRSAEHTARDIDISCNTACNIQPSHDTSPSLFHTQTTVMCWVHLHPSQAHVPVLREISDEYAGSWGAWSYSGHH